jgi:enoyl-CoA hydratase/carnithine racemase
MTSSSYGDVTVLVDADTAVATVEIHRPPDNYFDTALIADLVTALEELDADPSSRAVVLAAEGKNFCAGGRLRKPKAPEPKIESPGDDSTVTAGTARRLHLYEVGVQLFAVGLPIVAALEGAVIGGGLGLALVADFRVGAPETRLSANFAKLGFHHGFGLTVTLPEVVGRQRASELLLTAARIGGEEAYRIGLLDRLVPSGEVRAAAQCLAAEIAACAPLATKSIRATLRAGLVERIAEATEHEMAEQRRLMKTEDFAEGVQATAERRQPHFEGR